MSNIRKININKEPMDVDIKECKHCWDEDSYNLKMNKAKEREDKVGLHLFDNKENIDKLMEDTTIEKTKPARVRKEVMDSNKIKLEFWDLDLPLFDELEIEAIYNDKESGELLLAFEVTPLRHDTYLSKFIKEYELGRVYIVNDNDGIKSGKKLELISENAIVRNIEYYNTGDDFKYKVVIAL